jgi:hypothetical protein
VQERHVGRRRGTCQVSGPIGVDRVRLLAIPLGPVDIGPGRAVDRCLGGDAPDGALDGRVVGYVELGPPERHELVSGALAGEDDIAAQHPVSAGHEHPHAGLTGWRYRSCPRP